jgi:hypothetical protein
VPFPHRIISGGQTGVDRAALDVAIELGIEVGGWCPRGRDAEDGAVPGRYPLQETPDDDPAQRTEWNVRDADATLIIGAEPLVGGTALTIDLAAHQGRPCLVVDPDDADAAATIRRWLDEHDVRALNVAGPREREQPGIGARAAALLHAVLNLS